MVAAAGCQKLLLRGSEPDPGLFRPPDSRTGEYSQGGSRRSPVLRLGTLLPGDQAAREEGGRAEQRGRSVNYEPTRSVEEGLTGARGGGSRGEREREREREEQEEEEEEEGEEEGEGGEEEQEEGGGGGGGGEKAPLRTFGAEIDGIFTCALCLRP
eukprot:1163395-Rhodomonas_salina.1